MEKEYLNYYSLPGANRFTGRTFSAGKYEIWSWSLEPARWEGTFLVLHGFLDHSLSNGTLIFWLLDRGYRVIGADMPGHGRSTGIRGGIDSFDEYSLYMDSLIKAWDIDPSESFAIGHSTGASILINYSRRKKPLFRGIILAAPLVKMNFHVFLDKGIDLARDWIQDLPVKKTKSCRNKAFLKFKWKDPLGVKRFSLNWIKSMVDWNRDWTDFRSPQPVLVLQGRKDNVVEWRSNIPLLERCYSDCRVIFYKRCRHHILNEQDRLRKVVYADLSRFLEEH